jgi:hypothetical protein
MAEDVGMSESKKAEGVRMLTVATTAPPVVQPGKRSRSSLHVNPVVDYLFVGGRSRPIFIASFFPKPPPTGDGITFRTLSSSTRSLRRQPCAFTRSRAQKEFHLSRVFPRVLRCRTGAVVAAHGRTSPRCIFTCRLITAPAQTYGCVYAMKSGANVAPQTSWCGHLPAPVLPVLNAPRRRSVVVRVA